MSFILNEYQKELLSQMRKEVVFGIQPKLRIIDLPLHTGKRVTMISYLLQYENDFKLNLIISDNDMIWESYLRTQQCSSFILVNKHINLNDKCLKYKTIILHRNLLSIFLKKYKTLVQWDNIIYDYERDYKGYDFLMFGNFTWIIANNVYEMLKSNKLNLFKRIFKSYNLENITLQSLSIENTKDFNKIVYKHHSYKIHIFLKEMLSILPKELLLLLDAGIAVSLLLFYTQIQQNIKLLHGNLINFLMSLISIETNKIATVHHIFKNCFTDKCLICFENPKNQVLLSCCHNICCKECLLCSPSKCLLCSSNDFTTIKIKSDTLLPSLKNRGSCAICYENVIHENHFPIISACCKQVFCSDCIHKWLVNHDTCPLCRSHISCGNLIYTNYNYDIDNNLIENKNQIHEGKFEKISTLINKNPYKKFLILSSFDSSFFHLKQYMDKHNIKYISVNTKKIDKKQIKRFNSNYNPINIIFLSNIKRGTEKMFTNVSDIILYHSFDNNTFTKNISKISKHPQVFIHDFGLNKIKN